MKKYRGCLFFDIDGTLVDSRRTNEIDTEVMRAIRKAQENGYACLIASGRALPGLKQYRDIGMDGFVFSDGGGILLEGRDMIVTPVPSGQIEVLKRQVIRERGGDLMLSGLVFCYAGEQEYDAMTRMAERIAAETDESVPEIFDSLGMKRLNEYAGEEILEIDVSFPLPAAEEDWLRVKDPSIAYISTTASYGRNGGTSGEITAAGISKGSGARKAAELLGCDMNNTYAFGDSMNDAGMLKECAFGIAMGNAAEELKQLADYVTSDINEGGIVNAMEHFGIIERQ